jgi:hypothetical protein
MLNKYQRSEDLKGKSRDFNELHEWRCTDGGRILPSAPKAEKHILDLSRNDVALIPQTEHVQESMGCGEIVKAYPGLPLGLQRVL